MCYDEKIKGKNMNNNEYLIAIGVFIASLLLKICLLITLYTTAIASA